MQNRTEKIYKQRTSLWIWIMCIVISVIGCLIIFATEYCKWWETHTALKVVARQLGSVLLVSAVITLIWKLYATRVFLDEILLKARISRDIEFSGIEQVTDSFHTDVKWAEYIRNAHEIDIFFAYAQTWRNAHLLDLRAATQNKNMRIRVVLPDPENADTINELCRRFTYKPDQLKTLINEAAEYFKKLAPVEKTKGANVEIWFLPAPPTFTFYRFDNTTVLALYTHRKERVGVPTFVCRKGGSLYEYLRNEFTDMVGGDKPMAKKSDLRNN
jgi:uncharacterized membrane protein YhaH (DUF805 family)